VPNLPAPGTTAQRAYASASVAEVVHLYGLRLWIEQSDKQVKQALGWAAYQVRADLAIRRHWPLVCWAFSLCWWTGAYPAVPAQDLSEDATRPPPEGQGQEALGVLPEAGLGEKSGHARSADEERSPWPLALRRVCAWLEPGLMLWRYWRVWSTKAPPPTLHQLLDWLWEGHAIDLYIR
jgi:hypothetical protein